MRWLGHPIESPKLPYTGHHCTRRGKGKSGRLRTTLRRKITSELEEMGFSMGQAQYVTEGDGDKLLMPYVPSGMKRIISK
jgi:hypothetical protein